MALPRLTSLSQLRPAKLATEEVDLPKLGVSVLVWELTGDEVERWKAKNFTTKGGKVTRLNLDTSTARLLAAALKDESGNPQFNPADITEFMRRGAGDIAKVEKVARRLSGLGGDDDDDADEESEGNGSAPSGPSSTGSPSPSADAPETSY